MINREVKGFFSKAEEGYSIDILDNGRVRHLRLLDRDGYCVDYFDVKEKLIPVGAIHSSYLDMNVIQEGQNKGKLLSFIIKHNSLEGI